MSIYHTTTNGPVEVKKHQVMGPVGYTVVGSPSILDGVATGFSGSNYIKTSSPFNPSNNNWELVCSFIYQTGGVGLFGSSVGLDYQGVTIVFNSDKLRWCLSSNGTSWDIVGARIVGNALENGVKYKVKITYDGSLYSLYLATGNGDYTLIDSQSSSTPIFASSGGVAFGINQTGVSQTFMGSIDLNYTYIKINNNLWFYQPQPTKYIIKDSKLIWSDHNLYLAGPNTYTVNGSPSITDNIVSNITTSNFLSINNTLSVGQNPWEVYCKFTTGSNVLSYQTIYSLQVDDSNEGRGGIGLKIADTGKLEISLSSSGSSWLLVGYTDNSLSANTTYYTKQYFENGYYKLDLSTDGVTYTNVINLSQSGFVNNSLAKCYIGIWNVGNYQMPFLGSIDLKNTYIRNNGNLWFYGKNYATQNIAPVPAGLTFGTITTPSIGYIDIPTQTFTAAPEGATIGMDE